MKKIFFLIISVFAITACSPKLISTDREIIVSYFDFREYTNEGFFISPNMYTGEHESIGELAISIFPAEKIVGEMANDPESRSGIADIGVFYNSKPKRELAKIKKVNKYLEKEKISDNELLKIIVDEAKKNGADALVNFSSKNIYKTVTVNKAQIEIFSHYELSGFAIKRN